MSLLHNRGFVLLWSGQFLGILADWSLRTAVLIWVYKLTRSGVAVSLVGLAEALPLLMLAVESPPSPVSLLTPFAAYLGGCPDITLFSVSVPALSVHSSAT